MTIDPGGGAEWMVDLEGWGSNLYVAGSGLVGTESSQVMNRPLLSRPPLPSEDSSPHRVSSGYSYSAYRMPLAACSIFRACLRTGPGCGGSEKSPRMLV